MARPKRARLTNSRSGDMHTATSATATTAELNRLARHRALFIAAAVAERDDLTRSTQRHCANSPHDQVRVATASNPATLPEVLAWLSADQAPTVRAAAAWHPNTAPHILARLARDDCYSVRTATATNPNTPLDALGPLLVHAARAKDPDAVARAGTQHPAGVADTVAILCAQAPEMDDDEILTVATATAGT